MPLSTGSRLGFYDILAASVARFRAAPPRTQGVRSTADEIR